MTTRSYLLGFPGVAFITDNTGTTALSVGVPITSSIPDQPLAAALVSDSDVFYAPGIVNLLQILQPALVADDDTLFVATVAFPAQQTLVPALVTDIDAFLALSIGAPPQVISPLLWADPTSFYIPTMGWGLLPPLYTDQDVFNVTGTAFPLLPVLVADSDSFSVPAVGIGVRTLFPSLVIDADTFLSLFVTLVGLPGGPLQKLKAPPKLPDSDSFFSPGISKMSSLVIDVDVFRVPVVAAVSNVLPGFVTDSDSIAATLLRSISGPQFVLLPSDDAVYTPLITMMLQPALKADGDGILVTDVGWKLFGQLLIDVEFFPAAGIRSYNELLPEVWKDEETIDTYPFFLQQLEGGIPVLPREGILTGSIKQKAKLTGSITKRRLVA